MRVRARDSCCGSHRRQFGSGLGDAPSYLTCLALKMSRGRPGVTERGEIWPVGVCSSLQRRVAMSAKRPEAARAVSARAARSRIPRRRWFAAASLVCADRWPGDKRWSSDYRWFVPSAAGPRWAAALSWFGVCSLYHSGGAGSRTSERLRPAVERQRGGVALCQPLTADQLAGHGPRQRGVGRR